MPSIIVSKRTRSKDEAIISSDEKTLAAFEAWLVSAKSLVVLKKNVKLAEAFIAQTNKPATLDATERQEEVRI